MKKRALTVLLLLSVLALSLLGYFFTREERERLPLTLTLRAEGCDALLCEALTAPAFEAALDGYPCAVLSHTVTPHLKRGEGGVPYPSRLLFDVTFTVTLEGEARDGVPYGGENFLSVGKRGVLSSAYFEGSVVFLSIKSA